MKGEHYEVFSGGAVAAPLGLHHDVVAEAQVLDFGESVEQKPSVHLQMEEVLQISVEVLLREF